MCYYYKFSLTKTQVQFTVHSWEAERMTLKQDVASGDGPNKTEDKNQQQDQNNNDGNLSSSFTRRQKLVTTSIICYINLVNFTDRYIMPG